MKNIIQVAGIIDFAEAEMLMEQGVEYLGFPLRLPVHKEDISEKDAAEVIKHIPQPHKATLITYLSDAEEIIRFCEALNVFYVQLHGDIPMGELEQMKKVRPDLKIFKSLVVKTDNMDNLIGIMRRVSPFVDVFITDTFDPRSGASGATGLTHDWDVSRRLNELSPVPVILAGGLNERNVKQGILTTLCAGVDVHTGIEAKDGRKDKEKTRQFVEQASQGFFLLNDED
jgi:phosphoribosylanthranilate isomerase